MLHDVLWLWLQGQAVQRTVVPILATLTLLCLCFQVLSHWRVRRRLHRVELRHKTLIDKIVTMRNDSFLLEQDLRRSFEDMRDTKIRKRKK